MNAPLELVPPDERLAKIHAYIENDWFLTLIAPGTKGSHTSGWNKRENALTVKSVIAPDYGVGLLHAYSRTASLDVDNLTVSRELLSAKGIDLDAWASDPAMVQIVSGKPNRLKFLFKMPDHINTLASKKIMHNGKVAFELRNSTADGKSTVQCCLPPTVHPDTNLPYDWKGDWKKLPVLPQQLLNVWNAEIERDSRREIHVGDGTTNASWDEIVSALTVIDANCDRKTHTELGMSLKLVGEQLGVLDKAAQLFLDWSATGTEKFKSIKDVTNQFSSYNNDHKNPITVATLFMHARATKKWTRPVQDMSEQFKAMTLAAELEKLGFPASMAEPGQCELLPAKAVSEELALNNFIGLRLPYFDVAGEPVTDNGKPFSRIRVLGVKWKHPTRSRIGSRTHAYLPKSIDWRAKPREPVFIVIGELRAAQIAANGTHAIGLEWIGGYRDKAHGNAVVPELCALSWEGRQVFIMPEAVNTKTTAFAAGLAAWLIAHDAQPQLIDFEKYGDPHDFNSVKLLAIASGDKRGYVHLDETMGVGWEKYAEWLGKIAYVRSTGSTWVHLTNFCGNGVSPVRKVGVMSDDLENVRVTIDGKSKPVFDMVRKSSQRLEVNELVFYPHLPPLSLINNGKQFNLWQGFRLLPKANEEIAVKIRAAVRSFFSSWTPNGVCQSIEQMMVERYFWGWLAAIAQCKPEHITVSLTFQSKEEGIGKSLMFEQLQSFMGNCCKLVTPKAMAGAFNAWAVGALVVIINEPSAFSKAQQQEMKNMRTNATVEINKKNEGQYDVPNVMVFGLTTNEPYTYMMDPNARRDLVYSPTWLSVANAQQLPNARAKERAAHLEHNRLMVELATHLSPQPGTIDKDQWGSALYAELLSIDPAAMGFKANGPAPSTTSKTRMAMAGKSSKDNECQLLIADINARVDKFGGVLFSNNTLASYLHSLGIAMGVLEAKRLIEREVAIPRGLTVSSDNLRVGPLINQLYWRQGYPTENEQVRAWCMGNQSGAAASKSAREQWILATVDDAESATD